MTGRVARRLAAALLALPLLAGCASMRAEIAPTARLDPADARLDRADVACYHGVTFR